MKHLKTLLTTIVVLLCSVSINAHDFEVDGIYYNITSSTDLTVEVTHKGSDSNSAVYTGSVVIPSSVTYNGIIYSVTRISKYAFYNCKDLTSINIPESVISIGHYAIYGNDNLIEIHISDIGAWCNIDYESIEDNPLYYGAGNLYLNGKILTELILPNTITKIKDYAFTSCQSLTTINFPETLTIIGEGAFYYCFGIKTINISKNVTSIGDDAFMTCPNITSIKVEEGNKTYDSRYGCNAIIETNSNTLIRGCATTKIPEDVTDIGNHAFDQCKDLTSITIPKSVVSIGCDAFYWCRNLTSIICEAMTPPTPATNLGVSEIGRIFDSVDRSIPVHVPRLSMSAYQSAPIWNEFTNIQPIESETAEFNDNGEAYTLEENVFFSKISYTRTFNNTNWQALYVPFAMNYEDWAEDFDVAKINDIHQFDENGDDVLETTKLEIVKVKSGTLKANHPYMIRAKSTGEKTITVENTTLMAAEAKTIDCSSVELKYTFTGTYETVDGETMVNNNYYAMSGGGLKPTTNINASLKPFRWYMQITDREGQVVQDVSEVKVVVRGEDDWDATGIDEIETAGSTFVILGIDGRMVRKVNANTLGEATEGLATGVYVVNGKKHILK